MKLYPPQNPADLEPHYCRHVEAMTAEGLHEKSDIAAQLAARDAQLAEVNRLASIGDFVADDDLRTWAERDTAMREQLAARDARIAELEAQLATVAVICDDQRRHIRGPREHEPDPTKSDYGHLIGVVLGQMTATDALCDRIRAALGLLPQAERVGGAAGDSTDCHVEYTAQMPPADPEWDFATAVWAFYYYDTERHDRTLPGAWSPRDPDTWLPFDGRESNRHAAARHREAWEELRRHGIPHGKAVEAREHAGQFPFETQAKWPDPNPAALAEARASVALDSGPTGTRCVEEDET